MHFLIITALNYLMEVYIHTPRPMLNIRKGGEYHSVIFAPQCYQIRGAGSEYHRPFNNSSFSRRVKHGTIP